MNRIAGSGSGQTLNGKAAGDSNDGKFVSRGGGGRRVGRAGKGGPALSFDRLNGNFRLHRSAN